MLARQQGSGTQNRRIAWLAGYLLYLSLLLCLLALVYGAVKLYVLAKMEVVVSLTADDAGYFFKIAQNVVAGKGFTFDGINKTNGFQPLWLYALLPLAWLMRGASPEVFFRVALMYQVVLVVIAGIFFYYAIVSFTNRVISTITTVIFYLISTVWFLNGMESGVLLLCVSGLLAYSLRHQVFFDYQPKKAFILGLLLGLVLLARLDMIFLVIAMYLFISIWILWRFADRQWRQQQLKQVGLSLAGLGLVTVPYFLYNQLAFGALMPISGQLKNSFPHIVEVSFGPPRIPRQVTMLLLMTMVICLTNLFLLRSSFFENLKHKYFIFLFIVFSFSILMHYLNTALFMKWAVFRWHFSIYSFVFCLGLVDVLIRLRFIVGRPIILWLTPLFTIAVSGLMLTRFDRMAKHTNWHAIAYKAAVWTRRHTPQDAILAMKDAGTFGFFSQRAVINLDGLVNNLEYQTALKERRLNEYLHAKGVQYLVQHAFISNDVNLRTVVYTSQNPLQVSTDVELVIAGNYERLQLQYRSQLYRTMSDPITVYRKDELYRSEPYPVEVSPYRTVLVIWKLQ
ncbi:MAG: hypothetical protein ABDI19_12695 [Armatimonadota bacterium]